MEDKKELGVQDYLAACISEDRLVKVLHMTKRHVVKLRQRGELPASFYYRRKWWFPRAEISKFLDADARASTDTGWTGGQKEKPTLGRP